MQQQSTLAIAAVMSLLAFLLPRRYFLLPFVLTACLVPTTQRIVIGGLDFTVMRILVMVGVVRMFARGEVTQVKWHAFDKMILVWVFTGAFIYSLQWMDSRAIINRCGVLFDVVGMYWLFRHNMRDWEDIKRMGLFFAACSFVMAALVAMEWTSGQNPYEALGSIATKMRSGRYRCQSSFPHPVMLGLFWATLVPIFIGLAKVQPRKTFYWAATGAAIFVVCGTASSTPVATLLYILLLLPLFPYRKYGKQAFYGLCGLLFLLHIFMKAPVWHLIARANIVGGSTGWHRYHLIDESINHFSEWAVMGVKQTVHWGLGLRDVTNQYILEGMRGGFITLVLFVIVLAMAIRTTLRYSRRPLPRKQQWLGWCIFVSILGHCLSFIGVAYFGQIMMLLYLTYAIVGFVYEKERQPVRKMRPVAIQRRRVKRVPSVSRTVPPRVVPR